MLDIEIIRNEPERVREGLRKRNDDPAIVDEVRARLAVPSLRRRPVPAGFRTLPRGRVVEMAGDPDMGTHGALVGITRRARTGGPAEVQVAGTPPRARREPVVLADHPAMRVTELTDAAVLGERDPGLERQVPTAVALEPLPWPHGDDVVQLRLVRPADRLAALPWFDVGVQRR